MGFRTHNDRVTEGERAFMLASIQTAIEDKDVPIKAVHFSSSKKSGGTG